MNYTPLEQFEIYTLYTFKRDVLGIFLLHFKIYDIQNYALYFFILSLIFIFLSLFYIYQTTLILNVGNTALELLYFFIATLTSRHCGLQGLSFFPLFFLTFLFILFANVLGLAPLSFTLTSQLIIPVVLALTFNFFFFIYGFKLHGFSFFNVFVPKGVPVLLLPLVVVIEIISYFLRSFSLSVRLFANMMAGHTLLFILSSFVVVLSNISFLYCLIPFILVLGVCFLEIGIAFLQAYVFIVLLSIYITDSLHPHH